MRRRDRFQAGLGLHAFQRWRGLCSLSGTSTRFSGLLSNLVTADMNGDGLDDIVYTFNSNTPNVKGNFLVLGIDRNEPSGGYTTNSYSHPSSHFTTDIVTADFNRDGKMDVAAFGPLGNGADVAGSFRYP